MNGERPEIRCQKSETANGAGLAAVVSSVPPPFASSREPAVAVLPSASPRPPREPAVDVSPASPSSVPSVPSVVPPAVVFDLEVLHGPDEVGGWGAVSRMGVSVAVAAALGSTPVFRTFYGAVSAVDVSSPSASPRSPREPAGAGLSALADLLNAAPLVIGWNHVAFDYAVLRGLCHNITQRRNADLCALVHKATGQRRHLDEIALANLGRGKEGPDSADLPRLWRQGFHEAVTAACRNHVELTLDLYRLAQERGGLRIPGVGFVQLSGCALRGGACPARPSPRKRLW